MKKLNYADHPGVKANPQNLPQHIAVIMDGNGRWAKARGLSRTAGHRQGVAVARDIVNFCQEKKIAALTLFAFGMENWKRPPKEVRNLFRIFFLVLKKELNKLQRNNVRLRIIGDRSAFSPLLVSAIQEAEEVTRENTGLNLNIAVNYSGRWDLLHAVQKILAKTPDLSQFKDSAVLEQHLSHELSLAGLPEPDLFIRTGGVQRISNFMLWELAYTELFFTPVLWPDFKIDDFMMALNNFAARERRFGLTGDQLR